MSIFNMVLIVSFLGAIIGIKKPSMGGIPGLVMVPFLFYFSTSSSIFPTIFIISRIFMVRKEPLIYFNIDSCVFDGILWFGKK